MNTSNEENKFSHVFQHAAARAFIVAGFFIWAATLHAQMPPGGGSYGPTNTPIESWSFSDTTTWTDDDGFPPVSFTNLNYSYLGNAAYGRSLVVDTNVAAWLQYPVWASDGWTNLTVDSGTVMFWFAPNWNSAGNTNGGFGPGDNGRLFEVGNYTDDSSYGWWSIFVDAGGTNLYFAAQTNNLSSGMTVYLSAPIDWTTNYFHFVAVTYSPTNTALYLDGDFVTNGPGMTVYPGPEVLTNGFFIGSDSNGVLQAHGLFNTVEAFNYPLSADDIQTIFDWNYNWYMISPWNVAMSISSAPSTPSTTATPNVITGLGYLQWNGSVTPNYSTNANIIWITNVTSTMAGGTNFVSFTIQGGLPGYYYDVFATGALPSPMTNGVWYWMGQGNSGNAYTLPIVSQDAFLILGSPTDTDGDGLTSAYENLVSHTDPNNPDTDGDGVPDGWEVLLGMNSLLNDNAQPSSRANYSYTGADWLNGVSGIRSGGITTDNEGNVQSVSQ